MSGKLLSALAAGLIFTTATLGATFNVTRTDDPLPDGCAVGDCSLREAITDANTTVASDDINVPPGTYLIDLVGNDTLETGDLDISTDMTITGPATLDGQMLGRIMDIRDGAQVTLSQLRIQNADTSLATNGTLNAGAVQIDDGSLTLRDVVFIGNSSQGLGGALYARGTATLDIADCAFVDNRADNGAGIFANANVSVRNTLFSGNTALLRGAALYLSGSDADTVLEQVSLIDNTGEGSGGGAILFLARSLMLDGVEATDNRTLGGAGGVIGVTGTGHSKTVTIHNSWFNNNAASDGGMISFVDDDDLLEIAHSTISNNTAEDDGGGIYLTGGTINITNTTFSGNEAIDDGGAIYNFSAAASLEHVTLTGNLADRGNSIRVTGSSDDLQATFANTLINGECSINSADNVTSLGGNLEGPGSTCELNQPSDQASMTPSELGITPLRSNPGAAPTHELTAASLAREAGLGPTCDAVAVDQRFQPRQNPCSAGAVESNDLFRDGFESVRPLGSTVTVNL
ncbi:MAG: choice-of-anchor Q domain-containing protein [Pseudomonadota bacterium]